MPIARAIEEAHYPETFEGRDAALERLAFDELLALQLGMVQRRRQRVRDAAPVVTLDADLDEAVRTALVDAIGARVGQPIELTVDQDSAMAAIREDLARPTPMLRLLQGDVGSGKTAVAAYALAATARAGLQGALLAPTDLLARQHLETVGALLEGVGIGVTLLTGSLKPDVKAKAQEAIASGQALVVVGTHALIQEAVTFADLGLVIIDEQHRFGVDQRGQLEAKAGGRSPHVLLMTATPIPRTLGQVLYADLDVSTIRTPPVGRIQIQTGVKRPDKLEGTWDRVRAEAKLGHSTFVVVPLIEEGADEGTGAVAAESEAIRLTALLAPLRVGLVHGRMKAGRQGCRNDALSRWRPGCAGRHDRRRGWGRCPRRDDDGDPGSRPLRARPASPAARPRRPRQGCVVLRSCDGNRRRDGSRATPSLGQDHDGFELAEKDFELRKEGNVLGLAQSGFPRLRVASLQVPAHRDLAARARAQAETMLDAEGSLDPPEPILAAELERGWLRHLVAAEPASGT